MSYRQDVGMADVADDVEDLETVPSAAVRLHDNGQSTDITLVAVYTVSLAVLA
jgi:hypothetical protein